MNYKHYENYIESVKHYIRNNLFVGLDECPETVTEIIQHLVPTFEYLGIKTWIVKGEDSYQVIWSGNGDYDVAYVDLSLQKFNFREYPCFKDIKEMYKNYINVREHHIMHVRNGIVIKHYPETHPDFDNIVKFIEELNLLKFQYGFSTLYILTEENSNVNQ